MSLGEFQFISRIKDSFRSPEGVLGIGDDCAVLPQHEGRETLVSSDMLVEDVHFLLDGITPFELGWKSAAVNISDIAGMGGKPVASFLSLALPAKLDDNWREAFIEGYRQLSERFDCPLLGGDTTSSPEKLSISVTVLGECPAGTSLKRSGAKVGDLICVTGNLGASAAGLDSILNHREAVRELLDAHLKPLPRICEGISLREAGAHSCMDISDGVASDLRHICEASDVCAEVDVNLLPISSETRAYADKFDKSAAGLALEGGEDYELLFTADEAALAGLAIPYYRIGRIVPKCETQIHWIGADRDYLGYRHF